MDDENEQPCNAEILREKIRKEKRLPPTAIIPLAYVCPCPKCKKRYTL